MHYHVDNYMNKICKTHDSSISAILKENKLEVTTPRLLLLDIFEHATRPLTIKNIQKNLSRQMDTATIYRNLESLLSSKIIKSVSLDPKEIYYELTDLDHHHHIVCENCGKIVDIENCDLKPLQKNIARSAKFATINRHSLEFFGICQTCTK